MLRIRESARHTGKNCLSVRQYLDLPRQGLCQTGNNFFSPVRQYLDQAILVLRTHPNSIDRESYRLCGENLPVHADGDTTSIHFFFNGLAGVSSVVNHAGN